MQHLFSEYRLARARAQENLYHFTGVTKRQMSDGPYLATVEINQSLAADVFSPNRLMDLGIPGYSNQANEHRQKCRSIGDGLFGTQRRILVVHPAESLVQDAKEVLVNVAEVSIALTGRGPRPWHKWRSDL